MARIDLNSSTENQFIDRINRIESVAQRQWGTLDPAALLQHLTCTFEMSLNERKPGMIFMPIPGFISWQLFFVWFTDWPRGKIKGPENLFPPAVGTLEEERERCVESLRRFVGRLKVAPEERGYSPLLGNIPLRRWARVHGVHLDHHLRQFGV